MLEEIKSPPSIEVCRELLAESITRTLEPLEPQIYDSHRHHFGLLEGTFKCGKGIRAILVFTAHAINGGSRQRAELLAAAIELIHNFSLIHDDIEDEDRYRHHRPTVWVEYGIPKAIFSGNAMLKLADMTAQELLATGVAVQRVIQIQQLLTQLYLRMIEGQFLDLSAQLNLGVDEYIAMVDHKTGALFCASLHLGALADDTKEYDPVLRATLNTFGLHLGRLFQIRDDMIGLWSDSQSGKPVGADIIASKSTLPMVHLLTLQDPDARARAQQVLSADYERDEDKIATVLELMRERGTREWCQGYIDGVWKQALDTVRSSAIPDEVRNALINLGEILLYRDS